MKNKNSFFGEGWGNRKRFKDMSLEEVEAIYEMADYLSSCPEPTIQSYESLARQTLSDEGYPTNLKELSIRGQEEDDPAKFEGMSQGEIEESYLSEEKARSASRVLWRAQEVRDAIKSGDVEIVSVRSMQLAQDFMYLNFSIMRAVINRGGGRPSKTSGDKGELIAEVFIATRSGVYKKTGAEFSPKGKTKEQAYKNIQYEYKLKFGKEIGKRCLIEFIGTRKDCIEYLS